MEKKKRKIGLKYIVAGALILFFSLCWLFDWLWAKTYDVCVVSVSDEAPRADSSVRVEIVVRVTHFGKPSAGHDIYALPTAGSMVAYMTVTDEDGYATVVYTPYTETAFTPARDVTVTIRDQSNSVIWEINAATSVTLRLQPKSGEA